MVHYALDARTATPHFPGIGRYVTNLMRALVPQLNQGERLTLLYDPAYPLTFPAHHAITAIPLTASPFSVQQQWVIPQLLRRLDADLYHSAYYLMPYRPGVPTVLTVHDLIPLLLPEQSTFRAHQLFHWMTALALRAATQTIAVSEATRRDLVRHFKNIRRAPVVIVEAADSQFRPPPAAAMTEVRQRYHLPEVFWLYLGSNKPHKNLERLVAAYAQLRASAPPLVIAGVWLPEHPEARQRAAALGLDERRVRWLGAIPNADLPALYAAASLFIFPSLYEGFGLPPLEAMACGTAVACSNTSSLPEVVGDAAMCFDPRDPAAIVAALTRFLDDPALGEHFRQCSLRQAARFSWEYTAQKTLEVYRAITTA
ncbi:MAG TPA: glycosyltransferase family 1 protein [Anaerolineae bacterium]|nr:glycosyltransferase family 1 protein [Anaerolineae bacterium]